MTSVIKLPWARDRAGYSYVEPSAVPEKERKQLPFDVVKDLEAPKIAGRSNQFEVIDPAEVGGDELFLGVVNANDTPDDAIAFYNRYGPFYRREKLNQLFELAYPDVPDVAISEYFTTWQAVQGMLRELIEQWQSGEFDKIEDAFEDSMRAACAIEFKRVPGITQPRLILRPMSLLSLLHVQIAQKIAGNNEIHSCTVCGSLYVTGAGTSMRSHRRTCSDKCRQASYRQRQKEKKASILKRIKKAKTPAK